jgi:hypothetical protein
MRTVPLLGAADLTHEWITPVPAARPITTPATNTAPTRARTANRVVPELAFVVLIIESPSPLEDGIVPAERYRVSGFGERESGT